MRARSRRHPSRRRRRPRGPRILAVGLLLAATAALAAIAVGSLDRDRDPAEPAIAEPPAQAPEAARVERGETDAGTSRTARAKRRRAERRVPEPIRWRDSVAVGSHSAGELRRGVLLPPEGREWVSWDPILKRRPNREWRRWGTDRLIRKTLRVLREFGREHPRAPRVAVGDLSRPEGGDFGPQFGSIGHASHQNGLDVDVYYPRKDRRLRPPKRPDQVDLELAQDLVDRFVAVGAEKVFVGPSLGLAGPPEVVVPLVNHDNHIHFRLPLD